MTACSRLAIVDSEYGNDVGGTAVAVVAKIADHNLKAGLRHDIAETMDEGSAVVIALTDPVNELWVRRALGGASRHMATVVTIGGVNMPTVKPTTAPITAPWRP
jgi:hypothetical protein